jgi:FAD:protein FMN transferase
LITRRALLTLAVDRPAAPDGSLVRVHRTAMACRVEIALAEEDARAVAAARAALDEADRIEALLTVFRESSELSRVNRDAIGGATAVHPDVYSLLRRCARLHADTDGAFDITSTPLSRCWGFLARQGRVPDEAKLAAALARVGMRRVMLDDSLRTVRFESHGMELNLNAIGKGYALDRMAGILGRHGVRNALLSAGSSSVLALGGRPAWTVDIRSPLVARSRIARVRLRDGALGTSGPGEQFVIADGTRHGHVLDPRTGWPARGVLSASVVTADAAIADALSTAFLVGGCDLAHSYCGAHPNTLALVTVDDESQRTYVFGRYTGAALEE